MVRETNEQAVDREATWDEVLQREAELINRRAGGQ